MRLSYILKPVIVTITLFLVNLGVAQAHFQMIIPSDDMVKQDEPAKLRLDVRFWHPLQGHGMPMDMPVQFGVWHDGQVTDLKPALKAVQRKDSLGKLRQGFDVVYDIRRPGDYIFFTEPQPYWEPAEESFIVHYTKTVVNAFGLEKGWDTELGLKTEIVPLTRPYGLWEGNVFQGIVKVNGKPAPFTEVEVEYFDETGVIQPPADPMITQVVKADANGVFTYAMPWGGWWGFAALNTDDKMLEHDGKPYPVEIGAVLWLFAHPTPGH